MALQQEREKKQKIEAEKKAKEDAELKAKQEAELKLKQEADLKAKQDADAKDESDKKAEDSLDQISQMKDFTSISSNSVSKTTPISKLAKGKNSILAIFILETNIHKLLSDGFQVCLSSGMKDKAFMQELSMSKTMNGEELLLTIDDITSIIHFMIQAKRDENKFRYLYQSYRRIKNHALAKSLATEEILNYIASYFSILFTSPDAFEIEPQDVVQKMAITGGGTEMPPLPPGMESNPQLAAMMQMMMGSRMGQQTVQKTFTNIENEFFTACVDEGIFSSDREFTGKVIEE